MRRTFYSHYILIVLMAVLSACGTQKAVSSLKKNEDLKESNSDTLSAHITDTHWRLVELRGRSIAAEKLSKEPYLILHTEDNRVSGSGSCNSIFGNYKIDEGNQLRFEKMASTMMMCPDMQIEDQFLKTLENVDNFSLSEDGRFLFLNKGRMAPLAKFQAVNF